MSAVDVSGADHHQWKPEILDKREQKQITGSLGCCIGRAWIQTCRLGHSALACTIHLRRRNMDIALEVFLVLQMVGQTRQCDSVRLKPLIRVVPTRRNL